MKGGQTYIIFPTTTAAMAWEQVCKEKRLPGRLIPVPPVLRAGCGLAWVIDLEQEDILFSGVTGSDLEYELIVEVTEEKEIIAKWIS